MRNKTMLGLAAVAVLLLSKANATDNYKIDPAHTSVGFSVRHMGVSNVKGHFDEFPIPDDVLIVWQAGEGKVVCEERNEKTGC